MKWFESLFFLAAQISLSGSKSMSSMVFIIFLIAVNHKNDHFRGLKTNKLPKRICYVLCYADKNALKMLCK